MPRRTALEITMRARIKELERDLREGRKIQQREVARMQKDIDKANKKLLDLAKKSGKKMHREFKNISGKNIAEITSATFLADAAFRAVAKATRALTFAFREMMDSISRTDELSKMSRNLGLAFESLQALRTSFAEGGVDANAFLKAITKFNSVIGEASTGELEYKEIFDNLQISVRGANGAVKDTETLIYEVASAMQKLGLSAAEQTTAVKDLFGIRQGAKFLDILKQGPEHLQAMMRAADETGRVLHSSVGRSLEEIDNMATVINHRVESGAALAMAAWRTEAEALLKIWGGIKSAVIEVVRWLGKAIGSDYAGLTDAELTEQVTSALKKRAMWEKRLRDATKIKDQTAQLQALRRIVAANERLAEIEKERATRVEQSAPSTVTGHPDSAMMAEGMDLLGNMGAKFEIEAERQAKKQADDEAAAALKRQTEAQKANNEAMAEGQRLLQEMNDAIEIEKLDLQNRRITEMAEMMDSHFNTALDQALAGTKSLKDAFADMAKSIILDLVKMIAKQLLFNALAAMMPGGVTAGGGFSISKGLGIDKIFGFARGGAVQAGMPIEVGEQGREIFMPAVAGRVLSRPQAQQAMRGGGGGGEVQVIQNMNFALGVTDTVRAEMENMRPDFVESAKMGVMEAKQRGAMSGAFQ